MPKLLDQGSKRQTVMNCHLHCLTVNSKSPLLSVCGRDNSEPGSLPLPGMTSMIMLNDEGRKSVCGGGGRVAMQLRLLIKFIITVREFGQGIVFIGRMLA